MKRFKEILPDLIFNLAETALIVLMGMLLKLPINHIILIIITFIITRGLFRQTPTFQNLV